MHYYTPYGKCVQILKCSLTAHNIPLHLAKDLLLTRPLHQKCIASWCKSIQNTFKHHLKTYFLTHSIHTLPTLPAHGLSVPPIQFDCWYSASYKLLCCCCCCCCYCYHFSITVIIIIIIIIIIIHEFHRDTSLETKLQGLQGQYVSSPGDKYTASPHKPRLRHLTFVSSQSVKAQLRNHIPDNDVRILQHIYNSVRPILDIGYRL